MFVEYFVFQFMQLGVSITIGWHVAEQNMQLHIKDMATMVLIRKFGLVWFVIKKLPVTRAMKERCDFWIKKSKKWWILASSNGYAIGISTSFFFFTYFSFFIFGPSMIFVIIFAFL